MMNSRVLVGDCLAVMPTLDAASVDAIVTDPPYGLGFMGKEWDHGVPGAEFWREALRVAKPGAHLVAFGGTRTYHRLTCAIEDAGWEIHDCLSWLYGSGFPKHASKLKPAWEPIVLARKPAKYATPLNIDGCRIATEDKLHAPGPNGGPGGPAWREMESRGDRMPAKFTQSPAGRWPANVVLDEGAAAMLDAMAPNAGASIGAGETAKKYVRDNKVYGADTREATVFGHDAKGGASRFFYTAKASRAERDAGVDGAARRGGPEQFDSRWKEGTGEARQPMVKNNHPTVKPLALMQWLCRLITPKGGLVLDPFCGSGTTGRAAVAEGFAFLGIEQDEAHAAIARARILDYAPLFAPEATE